MSKVFPNNFLWGASTSGHQTEGHNTLSDWWAWEQAGNTESSGRACGQYELYPHDHRLARELRHNAHRFGIEWSRLQRPDGSWVEEEWDHYGKMLDSLRENGLRPVITLNHFTLPLWLAEKGGWLYEGVDELFSRFAGKAASSLARPGTDLWITLNEPDILAMVAYHKGEWPPCHKDPREAAQVRRNMLKAHTGAYLRMKEVLSKEVRIGIAKAVTAFHPCRKSDPEDLLAVERMRASHNHAFIRSVTQGEVMLDGVPREELEAVECLDFIGVNYYFRQFIRADKPSPEPSFKLICSHSHHPESGPLTDMGWEVYPKGLYEVLKEFSLYRLPLFVTENGIATRNDRDRVDYIRDHLGSVAKALDEGLDVIGYLHWSLIDNFEWAEGYSKKFGIVEVDPTTLERRIRPSAKYLASVIERGAL